MLSLDSIGYITSKKLISVIFLPEAGCITELVFAVYVYIFTASVSIIARSNSGYSMLIFKTGKGVQKEEQTKKAHCKKQKKKNEYMVFHMC